MRHVAGKAVDGTTVTFFVGGIEWPIIKVEYADNVTIASVSELGAQHIEAHTFGKYETEEKTFEMLKARWESFLATLPGNNFGGILFPIIVRSQDPDADPLRSLGFQADTLENCRITGIAGSYENSEAASVVVVKFKPQQILWNGKTINRVPGLLP